MREFKKLRVSLTPECNFSCLYCTGMDESNRSAVQHPEKLLSAKQFTQIIGKLHESAQLETVRLTGGEPLLHPEVIDIVRGIHELCIHDIRLTTNGVLLPMMANELKKAGLTQVNVSLDGISPEAFKTMSRRNQLSAVLRGIDAALEAGLELKINSVIMKGKNENEILPLLQFANERNIVVRFLELMKMGPLHQTYKKWLYTEQEMLTTIRSKYYFEAEERTPGATANYWKIPGGQRFGIIANESSPFCSDCNRLRLDSRGKIYGCIAAMQGIQVDAQDEKITIQSKLQQALLQKQPIRFVGHERSMQFIGG